MSHATKMQVNFQQSQESALVTALENLLGEGAVEVHEEGTDLMTYTGRKASNLPQCHVVVRRGRLGKYVSDAGYRREEDGGYTAYVDRDFFNPKKLDKIAQDYAISVATKNLKAQGYLLNQTVVEGKVRITATRYS